MFKRFFTIYKELHLVKRTTIFLTVLMATSLFAQSTLNIERAQKVDEKNILTKSSERQNFNNPVALTSGAQLFFTDYDYAGNNTIPKMLQMFDFDGDGALDVFAVGMKRSSANSTRGVNLVIGSGGEFSEFLLSDPAKYTGWGTMQIAEVGPQANKILVMGHQGGVSHQMNFDISSFVAEGADSVVPGNFPDFVYLDDGTYYVTNSAGYFYKSTDNLETVEQLGSFDLPDPGVTGWNSEYPLKKSPNGQHLVHFTMHEMYGGSNGGPGGADADSTDIVLINYSNDAGANWTLGEIIGRDGVSEVTNRAGYYPIFENFGQINGVVDNNGVIHVTVNGYGFWLNGTDTTFAYPALYWNSSDRNWIAISDEAVEQSIYADTAATYSRPGNGLGNAYPIPSVSEDGSKVVVMWQGPEYSGTPGVGNPNVWSVTTENPNEIHYTDLYYSYSADAGKTWSSAALVDGSTQFVQETFPYLNPVLTVDGATTTIDYVYLVDAIPGVSLFGDNNGGSDDSYWVYDSFTIDIVGVDEVETLPNSFSLEQNYPNPFNPTTKITYSIPEQSFVSVKVYDVLGSEVATLVNGVQNAGVSTIEFDASELATGLYIYTMKANSFTSSKKMLLIK